ncbi:hypothetical protein IC620_14730 [Hazenella sp. IB182357]|uniref:Uncharacterized protein n=1 Tax=Polycladospora coralii TaxID=2771432 RepID=A0A926ND35_9BACL|nr:hypothetical protein [Polycladospora coralii]
MGSPISLTTTPNNQFVYVINLRGGSISVIAAKTNQVIATISLISNPEAITITPTD